MKKVTLFFKTTFALAKPYWQSEDKWIAWSLLISILVIASANVGVLIWKNYWTQFFYSAIQHFESRNIIFGIGEYVIIIIFEILSMGLSYYFASLLCLRWRKWLTAHYVNHWVSHNKNDIAKHLDNPDQRIYQDLASAPSTTFNLFLGFFKSLLTVGSFFTILWHLSGVLSLSIFHHEIHIYGYLLWCAILYAVIGTWISIVVGRPFTKLNYNSQKYGGNFRYELVKFRDQKAKADVINSEVVKRNLYRRFESFFLNELKLIKVTRNFFFVQGGYFSLMMFIGIIIGLPRYLARQIKFGGLMQISGAFSEVQGALGFISDSYIEIALLQASLKRITEFKEHYTDLNQSA